MSARFVLTLIANPALPVLTPPVAKSVGALIGGEAVDWLDDGIAADIRFNPSEGPAATLAAVRAHLAGQPIDVVVQPIAGRRKHLFIADMDSTMIGQECIDELADCVGLKDHVAAITERAMRGEIDFEPALRERVALLKGLPVSVVDQVIADRVTLTPGGTALVRTMRANGAYTALVSGGFTLFTSAIAAKIGFHEHRANTLVVEAGQFAGRVAEPILGKQAKLDSLRELASQRGLDLSDTIAVGDGANDLAMIGEAGIGVAYHAKPKVAEAAAARIDHGDLTALLYLQGYRRADFVT